MATVKENIINALTWFKSKLVSSIVDNCSSTSTDLPLSAYQGKVLQDQITELNTEISDTFLNNVQISGTTTDYIAGLKNGLHAFYCQNSPDNPKEGQMAISLVWKVGENYALQLVFIYGFLYMRPMYSGTWQDWRVIYFS